MRISEFIERLEKFSQEHGDLEVETTNADGCRATHKGPMLAHRKVLQGRERNPGWAWCDAHRGDAVCRI